MCMTPLLLLALLASPDGGVPEIRPAEFYQRALAQPPKVSKAEEVATGLTKKQLVLVDLRSPADFARKHLKGAVNLPVTELTAERAAKVLPDKAAQVVVYCDDQLAPTRRVALTTLGAPTLQQLGYTDVRVLEPLWMRPDVRGADDQPTGGLTFEEAKK